MNLDGMGENGGAGAPGAGDGMDLDALLGDTSPSSETTPSLQSGLPGQGDDLAGGEEPYKFGGRTWKGGQKEAEAAFNKIYGGYSEQRGFINALKEAAKRDPESLAALARDPKMAGILSKLGIQAAEQRFQRDLEGEREETLSHDDVMREIGIERRQNAILREEWAFERKLGRPITPREQEAVYRMIERAENLTYEEAYFLAHREQLLKRQAQAAAASSTPQPGSTQAGGRPKPPPRNVPGSPAPGKKSVAEMSEQEWKENLKQSGIIKELLSKASR